MRTLLIAGNWKLNPTTTEAAVTLAEGVKTGLGTATDVHVAVCPPFVFLSRIDEVLKNTPIGLGAPEHDLGNRGCLTGEISGAMLVDVGCTHVILGHSERRHGMGETECPGEQEIEGRTRGKADPDRPHWCAEGRAAGRTDRGRAAGPACRLAGRSHRRTGGGHGAGLRAGLGDRHGPHRHARTGPGHPCVHPGLAVHTFGEATAARVVVSMGVA